MKIASYPSNTMLVIFCFLLVILSCEAHSSPFGFHRRGVNTQDGQNRLFQTTSSLSSRNLNQINSQSSPQVQLIAKKTKTRGGKKTSLPKEEYEPNLVPYEGSENAEEVPSLEEIRASLGFIGRTIANSVEVGIVTAGSYISGGVLGYGIGGVTGIPKHLLKSASEERLKVMQEVKQRIGAWNGNALKQAGSWARLSASFSGFHALSRVMRGGKEDKWNGIWGSAATGAFLSRKSGPQAMLSASASYAGITYALDMFFGSGGGGKGKTTQNGEFVDNEFGFKDAPVEDY